MQWHFWSPARVWSQNFLILSKIIAFHIIIHTFGLIVTMISFLNPQILLMPQQTLIRTLTRCFLPFIFLIKKLNELSNFDYDLILYFGTVCPQRLTQPQDNSPTVYSFDSMTSLLTHAVEHSTRPSFMPKANNQPLKSF